MSKTQVDVTELNRQMNRALETFAAKGKLPRENEHGIEVLVGRNTREGKIKYRLVSWDDKLVEVELDVPTLIREGRPYLENLLVDVRDKLDDHRYDSINRAIHRLSTP